MNVLDGRQMMIRPTDIEAILRELTPCSESSAEKAARTGKSSAPLAMNASAEALARLTAKPQRPRPRISKRA